MKIYESAEDYLETILMFCEQHGSARSVDLSLIHIYVPPMAELAMRLRAGGLSLPDGILTVADMVKELKKALCPSK